MNKGYVVYLQTIIGTCGYLKKNTINGYKIEELKDAISEVFNDEIRVFPTKESAKARIETLKCNSIYKDYIEYTCIMGFDGQQAVPLTD